MPPVCQTVTSTLPKPVTLIFLLETRKSRHREVESLAQHHTVRGPRCKCRLSASQAPSLNHYYLLLIAQVSWLQGHSTEQGDIFFEVFFSTTVPLLLLKLWRGRLVLLPLLVASGHELLMLLSSGPGLMGLTASVQAKERLEDELDSALIQIRSQARKCALTDWLTPTVHQIDEWDLSQLWISS